MSDLGGSDNKESRLERKAREQGGGRYPVMIRTECADRPSNRIPHRADSGSDNLRVGEVARYRQPNWRKVNGEWVDNPSEHEAVVTKIEENYVEFDRFVLPRKQVWAIRKSPVEIEIIDHNNARYAQLQKLRMGQPNTYNETSYR